MKIIYGIKDLEVKGLTAVTIGIFDGVHRGHQKVLKELRRQADIIKGKSCVITFEPHPLKILMPKKQPPSVISTAHKMRLLAEEGVDIAVIINFTKDFANTMPIKFADQALKKRLNAKILVMGENFVLGKDRSGDANHFKSIGNRFGFRVFPVKSLRSGAHIISSTLIRGLIMSGCLSDAKRLLGRDITAFGTVVKGAERGSQIGFPTANIDPHHEVIPPSGVYIVRASFGGRTYRGVVNIGFRPTFNHRKKYGEPVVELHIFDFDKVIYGRDIEISFLKKIRDEKRFNSKCLLVERVKKDIVIAKKYFKKTGK